ncbi:MAG: UDP-3-O-(3-hydroxymyristoyl)glucosamine N-acyltransferase [Burkholderiales bacterium]|nr:UDP-3-O-(3-hydroxymyristoyl)glucosamine N-acyltransferase [Burkholderiales bacterium]MDE2503349.1 UDP-3-O-(3-hydroxymyristoyl)glucosamine N-acyltransferase [Burkholderiales bacterium]
MQASASDIARVLGGELIGDPERRIDRIAALAHAGADAITFATGARYLGALRASQAACIIVPPALREAAAARGTAIVCADPYLAYARLTRWWVAQARGEFLPGVHPSAVVEPGAHVDPGARIDALAHVGAGASIAAGAHVGAQCEVGAGAAVGVGTELRPRVVLAAGCRIGRRGLVHSGAVIGADGFGFALDAGAVRWEKIEQIGAVVIGDDVEIGANTCIDRGAIDDTVIEDGVKLDNLIQIGHNCRIGAHTAIAGCTGIAGSTHIGARCTIAGAAMIIGHLEIADDVHITVGTAVTRSIRRAGRYSGVFPFDDNAAWEKNAATLRQLYSLRERLRALEKKIDS